VGGKKENVPQQNHRTAQEEKGKQQNHRTAGFADRKRYSV
jgi:hypothetical protein